MKTKTVALGLAALLIFTGCAPTGAEVRENLADDIEKVQVAEKAPDEDFVNAQMSFSLNLFKECCKDNGNENILISPLSAIPALAMTANGAKGKTLEEMEKVLGAGMTIDQLNEYLKYYLNSLTAEDDSFKMHMANSIWFRDDAENLTVEKDFLQTNQSYYNSEIYKAPFDSSAVKEINSWVNKNTRNMIDSIIKELNPDDIMCLINALAFEAEWEEIYTADQIHDGVFTNTKGEEKNVKMMSSSESVYLQDENATGFLKCYKGGKFSFGALLPNENIGIEEYINSLTSEGLLKTLTENKTTDSVYAQLPKFKYDYSATLTEKLKNMGMPTAFDPNGADFTKLGKYQDGNICIGDVLQKTFIQVDEKGTKAGAATAVMMTNGADMIYKNVVLDRPFLYMIVDNETGLPIFIGVVNDIN